MRRHARVLETMREFFPHGRSQGHSTGLVTIVDDRIVMPVTPRVRLWTLADAALWEALVARGELHVDPALISFPEYLPQYDWLRGQLRRRLPGFQGGYPWWAWAAPKPDLRDRTHHWGNPGDALVRLTLDLPTAEVICFDFDAWHIPLNGGYLGCDEEQRVVWATLPEGSRTRAALEQSWEHLFALDASRDREWLGSLDKVQAVFETLRYADVVAVKPFRSRVVR